MVSNPFSGTELEDSWQQGFIAGWLAPNDDHQAPSPLTPDQQDAYSKGVLSGQVLNRGVRLPADAVLDENVNWGEIVHFGIDGVEIAHTAHSIWADSLPEGITTGGAIGASLIFTFVSIAVWGPERLPFFEETAATAVDNVRRQLESTGTVPDNVELFTAACDRTGHADLAVVDQVPDELTRRGWWHGTVFLTFDQALSEATTHEHPDDTRVLRFQSAAPDSFDVIEVPALA